MCFWLLREITISFGVEKVATQPHFSKKAVNRDFKNMLIKICWGSMCFYSLSCSSIICCQLLVQNPELWEVGTFNSFISLDTKRPKRRGAAWLTAIQEAPLHRRFCAKKNKKKHFHLSAFWIAALAHNRQTLCRVILAPDAPLATASKYKLLY